MSSAKWKISVFIASVLTLGVLIAGPAAVQASAADYVIWGQGTQSTPAQNWRGVLVGVGSTVNGDVGSRGDIFFNGAVTVNGNVDTGSQYDEGNGVTVTGAVTENSSAQQALPGPAAIPAGTVSVPALSNGGSFTFAAGTAYKDVSGGGGCDLTFPDPGDYYFDSLNFANGTTLHINAGGPVRILVNGRVHFGSGTDVDLIAGGAANVKWEAHWAGTSSEPYAFTSGGGQWKGSIFTPYGGIHYGNGSESGTVSGNLWSGWDGVTPTGGHELSVYVEHSAVVTPPEGGSVPIIVNVEKTVNTAVERVWQWKIDKCVTPDTWNILRGDSAESSYTVKVDKVGSTQSYVVTGTISVTNNSVIPVYITSISDVITPGMIGAIITPPSGFGPNYLLGAGDTIVFEYEQTLPDGTARTNTASAAAVKVLGDSDQTFSDTKPVCFDKAPTTDVNDTVTVTDTYKGVLGTPSDDVTYHYSRLFGCSDEGVNKNTAKVIGSEGDVLDEDSACVTVHCYEIEVTKNAHTQFTRTFGWDIHKSVTPAVWNFFEGDSGTSDYTVTLTKDAGTDSSILVTGTITITNPAPIAATINSVTDVVSPDIAATLVNPPSFPLTLAANGGTITIDYSTQLPNTTNRTNTATAVVQNHDYDATGASVISGTTDFTGSSDVTFTAPTNTVNDTVHVTDSVQGSLGTFSGSDAVHYSKDFDCDHMGSFDNTATIVETGQNDTARVTVNCWQLSIQKDGAGTFDRTQKWDITKSVTPGVWNFNPGQSGVSMYTVTLTKDGVVDSNFAASGKIYIHNPAPVPATINSLDDVIQVIDAPGVLQSPPTFPYTLSADSTLTINYIAPLPDSESRTNKATEVQQNYHFSSAMVPTPSGTTTESALAQIIFGGPTSIVNDTVHVTDSWRGSLGTFSSTDSTTYPRTFTCDNAGVNHNIATIVETGQNASADVTVTCSQTPPPGEKPGLTIVKSASPTCIEDGTIVTYTYIVTNTGNTTLTNVVVTDDKLGAIGTIPTMAPTVTVTLTMTAPISADTINVGTATAGSLVATDDASVDVVHPAIEVHKTSDAPADGVLAGTKVTYGYTVENMGDVPLSGVDVVDDKLGTIATGLTLAVGETKTLPSMEATINEPTTNVVTATAQDACGHQVSDTDQVTVDIFVPFTPPNIALSKVADGSEFSPGDVIHYTLTYHNTGEGAAQDFTIVDDYDQRYVTPDNIGDGVDDGDTITWTIPGPVPPGGSGTINYTVKVNEDMPVGKTEICNTAVANVDGDSDTSNNTAEKCVSVTVEQAAAATPEETEEEFLPFTGGEVGLIGLAALLALGAGLILRKAGRPDA